MRQRSLTDGHYHSKRGHDRPRWVSMDCPKHAKQCAKDRVHPGSPMSEGSKGTRLEICQWHIHEGSSGTQMMCSTGPVFTQGLSWGSPAGLSSGQPLSLSICFVRSEDKREMNFLHTLSPALREKKMPQHILNYHMLVLICNLGRGGHNWRVKRLKYFFLRLNRGSCSQTGITQRSHWQMWGASPALLMLAI